jgi:hypothetical protein
VLHGKVEKDWVELYGQVFATLSKPDYGTAIDYSKPPSQPSPALASGAYVGTYRNDFFGEIEILAKAGGLVLQQGPHKTPFPMQHYDRDVFTYEPAGENAAGLSGVTFTAGAEGKATSVVVGNLNIHSEGTFTRMPTTK